MTFQQDVIREHVDAFFFKIIPFFFLATLTQPRSVFDLLRCCANSSVPPEMVASGACNF